MYEVAVASNAIAPVAAALDALGDAERFATGTQRQPIGESERLTIPVDPEPPSVDYANLRKTSSGASDVSSTAGYFDRDGVTHYRDEDGNEFKITMPEDGSRVVGLGSAPNVVLSAACAASAAFNSGCACP